MNETLQTIAQRHTCRKYAARPVEREKLDALALAAVQSPSAMNRQPWQIVVITDAKLLAELETEAMRSLKEADDPFLYERIMGRGGKVFYGAPCMFLVLRQPDTALDTGIVSANIALAAASLGLGSTICGMAAIPFDSARGATFRERVGMSQDWVFGIGVLVGYAPETGSPHEPDMTKVRFI